MSFSEFLSTALLSAAAGYWLHVLLLRRDAEVPSAWRGAVSSSGAASSFPKPLQKMERDLHQAFQSAQQPMQLLADPAFIQGVERLRQPDVTPEALLAMASRRNTVSALVALEALAKGPDDPELAEPILESSTAAASWHWFFAMRVLAERVPGPVVHEVLRRLDEDYDGFEEHFVAFVRARRERGETPTFDGLSTRSEEATSWMRALVERIDAEVGTSLLAAFEQWETGEIDLELLRSIGHVARPGEGPDDIVETDELLEQRSALEEGVRRDPPRPIFVVGPAGVGKRTLVASLTERLLADGWTIFEAGAAELLAGQSYFGQLEARIKQLVGALRGRRKLLWIITGFSDLVVAGRHKYSTTSILDLLVPHLQEGSLRVLAPAEPGALERALLEKPALERIARSITLRPLAPGETLDLARRWIAAVSPVGGPPLLDDGTLAEAARLAEQFLAGRAEPGRLLDFLRRARERRLRDDARGVGSIERADLLGTLGDLTGLPRSVLDDTESLDLERLRAAFESRVKGQPEAVTCLVERIAMIKAGVTDPTRPAGVFLFTGPTGTGKTEIAKTLAEYLFGSADRMVRLDMSEFQTAESERRILGEGDPEVRSIALVDRIREQPFSLVLLDEFEKAHENIWSFFLQVFDDGRLTDRRGRVADFRHAIIILTANIRSEAWSGSSIGFGGRPGRGRDGGESRADAAESVTIELERIFRPEFLNRIDRVVSFLPLTKAVLREVLEKELREVLERRGLRGRQWAVEWDTSAVEFLLERGFSETYGARPLKRAVERYLLSPLALAMVAQEVPGGDQFLFVRSDGQRIQVEFVDPDGPEPESGELGSASGAASAREVSESQRRDREGEPAPGDSPRLPALLLAPRGRREEVACLRELHDRLRERVEGRAWSEEKSRGLEAVADTGFWRREDRFLVLGRIEYLDRVEAALDGVGSLLERLEGERPEGRDHYSVDLVRRVGLRLWLLHAALEGLARGDPADAFLFVEGGRDDDASPDSGFGPRLAAMYRAWSRKRRMTLHELSESRSAPGPYRWAAAISGFAAWSLLAPEEGLHVLEADGGREKQRRTARVTVLPWPDDVPAGNRARLRGRAAELLASVSARRLVVVRRYRESPSPLVRDVRAGWRTGHLDRVLDGDFDLFA